MERSPHRIQQHINSDVPTIDQTRQLTHKKYQTRRPKRIHEGEKKITREEILIFFFIFLKILLLLFYYYYFEGERTLSL